MPPPHLASPLPPSPRFAVATDAKARGEVVDIPRLVPKVITVTPWLVLGWWFDDEGELHYDRMIQRGGYSYEIQVPEEWA